MNTRQQKLQTPYRYHKTQIIQSTVQQKHDLTSQISQLFIQKTFHKSNREPDTKQQL
ncbi:hypothetical protein HanXRQr2_Chr12g0556941 [Helianthus annuus]|uniref:Uncharacterized protein n=1 Tax=Helianthus annuus TaxID=4232 RepID=A0A9K3HJ31_HELAN|nr:hypothetical protein HanXRQr2_Chr12g0556941 [Helianthus annuus]KAJ0863966.1 hypothetical protein HanPSC8_Chr12g0536181 [Helianthus annuus]